MHRNAGVPSWIISSFYHILLFPSIAVTLQFGIFNTTNVCYSWILYTTSNITVIFERLVISLTIKFNFILKFHLVGNKLVEYFLFEIVNNLLNISFYTLIFFVVFVPQIEAAKGFLSVLRSYLDSLCNNIRSHTITNVQSNDDKVRIFVTMLNIHYW